MAIEQSPIARGYVHLVRLDPTRGNEIKKTRPCVIVSPDELNQHLRTGVVAPMTTGRRCTRGHDAASKAALALLLSINCARSIPSAWSNRPGSSIRKRSWPFCACFRTCSLSNDVAGNSWIYPGKTRALRSIAVSKEHALFISVNGSQMMLGSATGPDTALPDTALPDTSPGSASDEVRRGTCPASRSSLRCGSRVRLAA